MADDEWSALDEELEKALSGKKGRGKGGRGGDRGGSDHGSGRAGHPPVRRDAPAPPPPPRPSTSGARWTRSSRSSSAAARDPTKTAGTTARGPDVRTNPRSNTTIVNNNNNVNIDTNHTVSFRTKPLGSSLLLRPPSRRARRETRRPRRAFRRAPRGSLDVVVVCPRGGIRGSRRRLRRHHLLRRRHLHHLHHPLHSAASHRRHVSSDVPPSERRSRESAREIDLLERVNPSDPSVSSESLAVKKFTRVVDNPAPETIRDKAALDVTLAHLYSLLGGRADYANLPGEIPLVRRANFLWDRLRAFVRTCRCRRCGTRGRSSGSNRWRDSPSRSSISCARNECSAAVSVPATGPAAARTTAICTSNSSERRRDARARLRRRRERTRRRQTTPPKPRRFGTPRFGTSCLGTPRHLVPERGRDAVLPPSPSDGHARTVPPPRRSRVSSRSTRRGRARRVGVARGGLRARRAPRILRRKLRRIF